MSCVLSMLLPYRAPAGRGRGREASRHRDQHEDDDLEEVWGELSDFLKMECPGKGEFTSKQLVGWVLVWKSSGVEQNHTTLLQVSVPWTICTEDNGAANETQMEQCSGVQTRGLVLSSELPLGFSLWECFQMKLKGFQGRVVGFCMCWDPGA